MRVALGLLILATPAFAREGVSTLYALDPMTRFICFTDGGPGVSIQAGDVVNRCSHLAFNPEPDRLLLGVQGGEKGALVDLGTPEELARHYGYAETTTNGQGRISIVLTDRRITIRAPDTRASPQPLREQQFLSTVRSQAVAAIVPGHVMLARLVRSPEPDLFVKFIVLAHLPGQSVTLRWAVLRPGA